ncbi:hypothetical protein [Leucobacter massiliensis]|uniref:DUF4232 domain-containing protein n=1 Tax=Leucobacter massiliensis TaxID=1686285 RepID=A0A2S9QSJ7_9MICO|nr:hypothetical protein [Leucobacter massiliensis]PRI12542.1 hypothetical protein B4915_00280 [Leucobacter massiliensis]PRI12589.1 hypothetical protein B4915_00545 [Leucobacter massiliensis]
MSTLRDPVGPKGRKVYMRRRLLVLAGLLAVIAVIVLVFLKPGSNSAAPSASEVEVPGDLPSSAPEGEPAAGDGEQPPECAAGQLTVTPITDKSDYAAGEQPQLSLSVENTGDAACSAELGTAGMEFAITSGEDEVWRSKDCQKNPESLPVILEPGKPLVSESIAWDRTRSSPETCDITRDPVSADGASYHLRVSAGGVSGSGTAQFLLF